MNDEMIQEGVRLILDGLDLSGEDVRATPERMCRALKELCSGVGVDIDKHVFEEGIFEIDQSTIRVPTTFTEINARGICPHHLLPIIYRAEVRYAPRKKVVGLSRIHRLVRILALRPVLQEQLVYDIANTLRQKLDCPVHVKLSGIHMCMVSRGSKTDLDAWVTTELELA